MLEGVGESCFAEKKMSMHADCWERKFATLCLQATASHYFIHWFDATKFCEQPDNVIFNRDTSLLDGFHCNNVTQLNQTTWFMYPNQ